MRSIGSLSWIRRAAGLAPAPVPPAVFALAAERLAFGAFRSERGGFAVREVQSVPLRPGTFTVGPLGGPLSPGVFKPIGDDLYVHVVMPVRTTS